MTLSINTLNADALALLRHHNLLRTLVERRVVDEAVEQASLSEDEKAQARESFSQRNRLQNPEDIDAYRARLGLSPEDLDHQILRPYRIQKHCETDFQAKAEAHFLTRKTQLDQVVYSLLRVKDRALARELYLRIANREANFADLAAAHAEGPERSTKGIVGPVPLTQANPQLADRLRTSSPGVLKEPFRIDEWWLVTRLESYTPATFSPEMAKQMSKELFDVWVQEETDSPDQQVASDLELMWNQ